MEEQFIESFPKEHQFSSVKHPWTILIDLLEVILEKRKNISWCKRMNLLTQKLTSKYWSCDLSLVGNETSFVFDIWSNYFSHMKGRKFVNDKSWLRRKTTFKPVGKYVVDFVLQAEAGEKLQRKQQFISDRKVEIYLNRVHVIRSQIYHKNRDSFSLALWVNSDHCPHPSFFLTDHSMLDQ